MDRVARGGPGKPPELLLHRFIIHLLGHDLSSRFFKFFGTVLLSFTSHTIHPCEVYDSVVFSLSLVTQLQPSAWEDTL